MSVRRFLRMMVGVMLCLMMQLPPLVMRAAPVSGMDAFSSVRYVHMYENRSHDELLMAGMGMMAEEMSPARANMENDMAPCCQSHHAVCQAGLPPEGQKLESVQLWQKAFLFHEVRLFLRSSTVQPWRPPATLPV
ncbi:hypothetical protein NQF87_05650 [Bombella sp. TMW 2.2559]|uniref:DUF2946 domain-containing protein n=1 Tax=Bombella dulcis TaxID=2967339 RepID=A0ABT3WBX9_9PROT|nr:hypothetical protein [Bombella dulcis]MCX5616456.1 hypothetical protein [Bombella dulcis]